MTTQDDWAPDACTLPTSERPLRIAAFSDLFGHVLRWTRSETTRLDLVLPSDIESAARDLAGRESECCSFFTFTFEVADDHLVMHICVPTSQVVVLDAIETRVSS
ncbi:hypothetical protein [Mycolicibacterium tusciae]|uniref:Uncharacterized protein n=1 Tax=Mycolicibacterium tusciae TaxID=75922 RepID=A0A1X0JG26_9MYCO|nr:hypothetical protein [Mycolicibacterium tusciae]ORB61600.1 hypothetical protein BST47_27285 [Mycolicibacterium tusciae]